MDEDSLGSIGDLDDLLLDPNDLEHRAAAGPSALPQPDVLGLGLGETETVEEYMYDDDNDDDDFRLISEVGFDEEETVGIGHRRKTNRKQGLPDQWDAIVTDVSEEVLEEALNATVVVELAPATQWKCGIWKPKHGFSNKGLWETAVMYVETDRD